MSELDKFKKTEYATSISGKDEIIKYLISKNESYANRYVEAENFITLCLGFNVLLLKNNIILSSFASSSFNSLNST
jgi:hypothetical protein